MLLTLQLEVPVPERKSKALGEETGKFADRHKKTPGKAGQHCLLRSECECLLPESMSQEQLVIYLGTVHLGERRRVMYSQVSFSLSDTNCPLQNINAPVFLTCISGLLTESLGLVHNGGLQRNGYFRAGHKHSVLQQNRCDHTTWQDRVWSF